MRISIVLVILLTLALVTACAPQPLLVTAGETVQPVTPAPKPGAPPDAIQDIVWHWRDLVESESASRQVVPNPESYTILFRPDGSVHIQADCNLVQGSYRSQAGSLVIEMGPSTMAFCGEESLDQVYLALLGQVDTVAVQDGSLKLGAGAAVLSFVYGDSLAEAAGQADIAAVTGQVVYRQRIALPPDAVLQVQIQDVSLADAPAKIMGEQVIRPAGQVPIPYRVGYTVADIVENHTYSMSARITDGSGKLLFISDTHTPVITNGSPTGNVEIVVVPVGS